MARGVAAAPQQHTDAALAALTATELRRVMAVRGVGPPDEDLIDFGAVLCQELAAEGGAEENAEERTERDCRIALGAWRLARPAGTQAALEAEFKADYGRADLYLDTARVVYDQCGGREVYREYRKKYYERGGRQIQREYQREYYVRAVVQALVDDIREHVVARCARDAVPAGQVPPPSTVCFGGAVRATRPKRSSKAPKKYAS